MDKLTKTIDELDTMIETLSNARKGLELLSKISMEMGAYGDSEISEETRWKLNDFRGFDDSE